MIALTGATGFVGRQIMRALIEAGSTVRAVVRDPRRLGDYLRHPMVQAVIVDDLFASNESERRRIVKGIDTFVHAAWYAVPGRYLHAQENLACVVGTVELARTFVAEGGRRFVGVGSCAEYAPSEQPLDPCSPLMPTTLYAASKVSTYYLLQALLDQCTVEFAWCRLFYLFGEGEDERRLIPTLRRHLSLAKSIELGSGNQLRDYLDVRDAGAMIAASALGHKQGAQNICSGVAVSVRKIAEDIADEYGRRDLLRFGLRPQGSFDPGCVVGRRDEI